MFRYHLRDGEPGEERHPGPGGKRKVSVCLVQASVCCLLHILTHMCSVFPSERSTCRASVAQTSLCGTPTFSEQPAVKETL